LQGFYQGCIFFLGCCAHQVHTGDEVEGHLDRVHGGVPETDHDLSQVLQRVAARLTLLLVLKPGS